MVPLFDARTGDRRPFRGGLVFGLVGALFLGWYVSFGPGGRVSLEPTAIEAIALQPRPAFTQPTPAGVVIAPSASGGVSLPVSSSPMTEEEAVRRITVESEQDGSSVTLHGQWAAQLASRFVGMVDPDVVTSSGSHTLTAKDILAEHVSLHERTIGTTLLLLDSRSYGQHRSYKGDPYWVTLALDDSFTDEAAVEAWCEAEFPTLSRTDRNNYCLSARLTP